MLLNLSAGLTVGLFSIALFFGLHALDELRSPFGAQALWTAVIFHGLTLVLTLWRHRSREPEIPFSRLLAAGLMITLVAAVVGGAGHFVFLESVDPGFLEWVKEETVRQIHAQEGLDPAEQERQVAAVRASTASSFAVQGVIAVLIRGFLLSLPIAALLRLRAIKRGA